MKFSMDSQMQFPLVELSLNQGGNGLYSAR